MLRPELKLYAQGEHGETAGGTGPIWKTHYVFNRRFGQMREAYTSLLHWTLDHRIPVLVGFAIFVAGSLTLAPQVGRDFFPTVDSGQMRLHARAPSGTRLEETEVYFAAIEDEIRRTIPAREIDTIIDNIGIPAGSTNLAFGDATTIGPGDGDILISLKEEHGPTPVYTDSLRKRLHARFPDVVFFFEPANITNQILNFGLPAPIDVQVVGRNQAANYEITRRLLERISRIPGAADVHIHQVVDWPEIRVTVDRGKAGQLGLTQRDVSSSLLISLASSGQVAPTQWLDWTTGVNYSIAVQTPQYRMNTLAALMGTPIGAPFANVAGTTPTSLAGSAGEGVASVGAGPNQASAAYGNPGAAEGGPQLLSNLAGTTRGVAPEIVNHFNVTPVYDVYANVDRSDLGSVGSAVEKIVAETEPSLPRGSSIEVRGQIRTMQSSFQRLGLGMAFAVALVYLLMAVNFQSWLDPFIILMALPGAIAGIVWILFITQTTFSVPSLMGSIMCIGVATSNSILVVVFANDQRLEGMDARAAALAAGHTRIRPVLMTAAAMVIGMLPMALGMGEGGEQNAPLGRAVIGGLVLATLTTLFIVPIVYSLLRKKAPVDYERRIAEEESDYIAGEGLR
jgi:multidrug efflux pump subunit AcrB